MAPKVRVYEAAKNAMQSGRGKKGQWIVSFVNWDAAYQEPLMGWRGTKAPCQTWRLTFASKEDALHYLDSKKIPYTLEDPKAESVLPKQYGHHFRAGKIL